MTIQTNNEHRETTSIASIAQTVQPVAQTQARRIRRERDFGVGYGSSSGYASGKRYVNEWAQPRFRCA